MTVNNRYVLVAFRGEQSRTEFILPPTKKSEPYIEQADYTGRFDPIYDEYESERPWFVGFDGIPNRIVDEEFREVWMSAVNKEMERAEKAPQRRYHDPVVYRAAQDREYREKVIREAFNLD